MKGDMNRFQYNQLLHTYPTSSWACPSHSLYSTHMGLLAIFGTCQWYVLPIRLLSTLSYNVLWFTPQPLDLSLNITSSEMSPLPLYQRRPLTVILHPSTLTISCMAHHSLYLLFISLTVSPTKTVSTVRGGTHHYLHCLALYPPHSTLYKASIW